MSIYETKPVRECALPTGVQPQRLPLYAGTECKDGEGEEAWTGKTQKELQDLPQAGKQGRVRRRAKQGGSRLHAVIQRRGPTRAWPWYGRDDIALSARTRSRTGRPIHRDAGPSKTDGRKQDGAMAMSATSVAKARQARRP